MNSIHTVMANLTSGISEFKYLGTKAKEYAFNFNLIAVVANINSKK